MTGTAITVRTLRQLDALVEEHILKGFSKEILDRNPELAPKYSTWLGLEPVIRNREDAGFEWSIGRNFFGFYSAVRTRDVVEQYCGDSGSAPVAFCLAALASVGVRVELELED
jgi:hypothetical protein